MESINELAEMREGEEREEREERIKNGRECPDCARSWIRYRIRTKEWVCLNCGRVWEDTRHD